jgi:hypothetical protein
VTFEVMLLALATSIRPTSLAAVYTLLSSASPRRLMIAYDIAGLLFTIAIGVLIVWAFNGIDIGSGTSRAKGVAEIAGGVIVLAFTALVLTGRVGGGRTSDAPRPPSRWTRLLEGRLTVKTAALAGPVTHIPGVFYLVALNLIIAHDPSVATGIIEILIYNVIWFALPLTASAVCIVRPDAAREAVGAVESWGRRHTRTILAVVSPAIGVLLVVRGLLAV